MPADQPTTDPNTDIPYIGLLNAAAASRSRVAPSTRAALQLAAVPFGYAMLVLGCGIGFAFGVRLMPSDLVFLTVFNLVWLPFALLPFSMSSLFYALMGLVEPGEPAYVGGLALVISAIGLLVPLIGFFVWFF